jgi:hypothetical protein
MDWLLFTVSCAMLIVGVASFIVGVKQMRAARKMYNLALNSRAASTEPMLKVVHEYEPSALERRGVIVRNYGSGYAVHVRVQVGGMQRSRIAGPYEKVEFPVRRGRDLGPGEWELISRTTGAADWREVWGTVTYSDLEGGKHRSWKEEGDEDWQHERVNE